MLPAALQNRNIYKEFYKKLNKKELKNLQKRRKKNFFSRKKTFFPKFYCVFKSESHSRPFFGKSTHCIIIL